MEAAKRLAPAAGTFEFCGECQRVSALIEDGRANMVKSLMMLLDDDRQKYGTSFQAGIGVMDRQQRWYGGLQAD